MSGTKIITPKKFKEVFLSHAEKEKERIISLWREDKKFTELMLGYNEGIVAKTAEALGQKYYREYWTIDAVYFKRKIQKYFSKLGTYAEYLSAAIEHENLFKTSHEEMNKLSMLNCPLKVLITYPPQDEAPQLLKEYADILSRADIFKDFTLKRKHLMVFRYLNRPEDSWSFFVYQNGDFTEV